MAREPRTTPDTPGVTPPSQPSGPSSPARESDATDENGDRWTTRPEAHPTPSDHPAAITPPQVQTSWALRIVYESPGGGRRVLCGTVRRVDPPEEVTLIGTGSVDTPTAHGPRLVLDAADGEKGVVLVIPPHDHGAFPASDECPRLGPENYVLRRRAGPSRSLSNDGTVLALFRVVGSDTAGGDEWRRFLTPGGEMFQTRKQHSGSRARSPPGDCDGTWARQGDLGTESDRSE
jgi:hypothetical protein